MTGPTKAVRKVPSHALRKSDVFMMGLFPDGPCPRDRATYFTGLSNRPYRATTEELTHPTPPVLPLVTYPAVRSEDLILRSTRNGYQSPSVQASPSLLGQFYPQEAMGTSPPVRTGHPHTDFSHPSTQQDANDPAGHDWVDGKKLQPPPGCPSSQTPQPPSGKHGWTTAWRRPAGSSGGAGHQGSDALAITRPSSRLFGGEYGRLVYGKSRMRVALEAVTCQCSDSILSALNKAHGNCQRSPTNQSPSQ